MALHARLSAPPPPPPQTWPWHSVKAKAVPVSLMSCYDRRLEAETFLAEGSSIRLDIESRRTGWSRLSDVARVWMPGRLKGVQVASGVGTPFLTATQMFDARPVPRKWLSVRRTPDAANRFVTSGQILVTCSGAVGRATVALNIHENTIISHDILRVDPLQDLRGWVYAFLLSPQAKAMAIGAHYGHIIKHLEPSHLDALPIPNVSDSLAADLNDNLRKVIRLRDNASKLMREAESLYADALGKIRTDHRSSGEIGFVARVSTSLETGRRRFEAAAHNPAATSVRRHLQRTGRELISISDAGFGVWLPGRFKRILSENGVPLLSTADLGAVNPQPAKLIKDGDFGDPFRGRVKAGWILVPRSGQVYGILGTPTMALKSWEDWVVSDDALRIRPVATNSLPVGYVAMALGHPEYGRPLVKALAYGSSIPHIDPGDLASLEIPRLDKASELRIANLVESATESRSEADLAEQAMARAAEKQICRFMSR